MTPRTLLLIVSLAIFWGPAFMFMKIALDSFAPITIATLRVTIGALTLLTVLLIRRTPIKPYLKYWKHFAMMGFFASALPFCLFPTSEKYISSALAGIINGSTPIFTAILAHYFCSERFSFRKLLGICTGIAGIVIIFLPNLFDTVHSPEFGIMLALLASISYAVGMVYARRHIKDLPFLVAPTFQLIFAAIYVIPFSLIVDKSLSMPMPSLGAIGAILGLGFISTAIAFTLYYTLIREAGASYLSMSTLFFPIVAILLGYFFLDETLAWYSFAGAFLIISGLFISSSLLRNKIS